MDDLETVCRLSGVNRSGAICKGYIGDARKMEGLARERLRLVAARGQEHPRTPEAIDVVVMADAMWSLAGVWFVVWLTEWARRG